MEKPDKAQIKEKLSEKLPDILKTVIVHVVMLIYHISMPPWVTAIKAKKALNHYKAGKNGTMEEAETFSPQRRSLRREHRRHLREERRY